MAEPHYMESMIFEASIQWGVYILSAMVCFWAWDKMFFWVKNKDVKTLFRIFGAVLLFTPAPLLQTPVDLAFNNYAPAFVVILFRTFLEKDAFVFDAVICMLIALCVCLLLMALMSFFQFLRAKPSRT